MAEPSREIYVEPSVEQAAGLASRFVKAIVAESVQRHGCCYVALSGGTTPRGLYLRLAADGVSGDVPWQDVVVFLGDERDVPHDHIESNFRMAQRALLDHVPINVMQVHPMRADAEDLQAAAAEYEQTIRRTVPANEEGMPCFDLVLLGMGMDGHVASLFPGTEVLEEARRLVVSYFVPVLGRRRMTLTYPLINAARNVVLIVTGSDKAETVARLLGKDPDARRGLPASGVQPTRGSLRIILDTDAARIAGLRS